MAEYDREAAQAASEAADRARAGYEQAKSYAKGKFQEARRGVASGEHREGEITRAIEHYTSMIPSGGYLSLAFGAIGAAALLQLAGRKHDAQFVDQWVPTILIMGLYNKLVRLEGSD